MDDKIVLLNASSKTGKLISNIEDAMKREKELELLIKSFKNQALHNLKEREVKKVVIDDGQKELLTANVISTERNSWDDSAIKSRLTPEQLKKVSKTTVQEVIDYNLLTEMVFDGEVSETDFNAMFKKSTTEYIKIAREKRK